MTQDREQEQALAAIREECTERNLWRCIVAFQGVPFYTSSGLPFTYRLKVGRNGAYTRELFIDRRENSKSLAFSSVRMAFEKALEQKETVFARPKAIADIRGVSYSYSLLWRFGVIRVPEDIRRKLSGETQRFTVHAERTVTGRQKIENSALTPTFEKRMMEKDKSSQTNYIHRKGYECDGKEKH